MTDDEKKAHRAAAQEKLRKAPHIGSADEHTMQEIHNVEGMVQLLLMTYYESSKTSSGIAAISGLANVLCDLLTMAPRPDCNELAVAVLRNVAESGDITVVGVIAIPADDDGNVVKH